jgi:hypothetical protein
MPKMLEMFSNASVIINKYLTEDIMSWFSKIFSGSVGTLVQQVGDVADKFHLSGEEKQQFKLQMESLLQQRDSEIEASLRSELQAKEKILVAELTQGDSYTKRARPTVVYAGLVFIALNYVLVPIFSDLFGQRMEAFVLPSEFWYGWSGIVATWSVGRTFEKRGAAGAVVRGITGSKPGSRLLDDTDAVG